MIVFRVKVAGKKSEYLALMRNVLPLGYNKNLFDLKGSTYGRLTPAFDSVKKDLNFLNEKRSLKVSNAENRDRLIQIMKQDLAFLRQFNVIDYSFLTGW